ncbi:MAG: hypothetical protein KAS72_15445 [Phycisphaerales bacterium]|nr:hypothetical protein [Phycisphaerales bacterium]
MSDTVSPSLCIINCENTLRSFYLGGHEGPDSIVEGLTITNGNTTNGGGTLCVSSDPTLNNCVISGNVATGLGGGARCGSDTGYAFPSTRSLS